MLRRSGTSLLVLIYLGVGLVVALDHGYNTIKNVSDLLSLVLAMVLWPAVLLGHDLQVHLVA